MKVKTLKKNSVSPLTGVLRNVRFETMTPGKREKERKSNVKAVILTVFRLHKVAPAGNECYFCEIRFCFWYQDFSDENIRKVLTCAIVGSDIGSCST